MFFSIDIPLLISNVFPLSESVSESQDLRCSVYIFVESNFGHRNRYSVKIIYHEISFSAATDTLRKELLCSYRFLSIDHGLQTRSAVLTCPGQGPRPTAAAADAAIAYYSSSGSNPPTA